MGQSKVLKKWSELDLTRRAFLRLISANLDWVGSEPLLGPRRAQINNFDQHYIIIMMMIRG